MNFETNLIDRAFKACYGLQDSLDKAIKTKDKLLYEACINSLQINSGLRKEYLTNKFRF